MKNTRQGVRDLNDLPSKPRGRRLPEPPVQEGERFGPVYDTIPEDCQCFVRVKGADGRVKCYNCGSNY